MLLKSPSSTVMLNITPRTDLWEGHQPLWALCFFMSSSRLVNKRKRAVSHTSQQMDSQKAPAFGKLIDSHRFLRVGASQDDIWEVKTRWKGTCEIPLAAPLQAPVLLVWTPGREIFWWYESQWHDKRIKSAKSRFIYKARFSLFPIAKEVQE